MKKKLEKSLTMPKGGPFGNFQHPLSENIEKLKGVSKNSKYQTHEKPKRRNWCAGCPLARAPGALKEGSFCIFEHPLLPNIKKLKDEKIGEKHVRKKSHNAEKS